MNTSITFKEYDNDDYINFRLEKVNSEYEVLADNLEGNCTNIKELKCKLEIYRMNSTNDDNIFSTSKKVGKSYNLKGLDIALATSLFLLKKYSIKNMRLGFFISTYDTAKKKFVPTIAYLYDRYAYYYKSDLFFIKNFSMIKTHDKYHVAEFSLEKMINSKSVNSIFELPTLSAYSTVSEIENEKRKKSDEMKKETLIQNSAKNKLSYENLKIKYKNDIDFNKFEKSILKIAKSFEIVTDVYNPKILTEFMSKLHILSDLLYKKYSNLPIFPLNKITIYDSEKDYGKSISYHVGSYDVSNKSININIIKNAPVDNLLFTFAHEFGHFLDYSYLAKDKNNRNLFLKEVRRENYVKALRAFRTAYQNKNNTYMVNYLTYRLKGDELFAELFAILITNQSKIANFNLKKYPIYSLDVDLENTLKILSKFLLKYEKKKQGI